MKLVIFLLYNNLFIYQVVCTLIYRRRSLYSFLIIHLAFIKAFININMEDKVHHMQTKQCRHYRVDTGCGMEGWTDGQGEGRTDGQTDGWTEWNQYTPQQLPCAGGINKRWQHGHQRCSENRGPLSNSQRTHQLKHISEGHKVTGLHPVEYSYSFLSLVPWIVVAPSPMA